MTYRDAAVVECPACGPKYGPLVSSGRESVAPEEGDVVLCIHCTGFSQWRDRVLVPMDSEAFSALPTHVRESFLNMQRALRAAKGHVDG